MATRRPTGISAPNGDIWEFQDAKVGDLTQTGVTGATVAAQISKLNAEIGAKVKKLAVRDVSYTCTSTNYEYTGVSVACPTGHTYIIRAQVRYSNAQPTGIIASAKNTSSYFYERYAASEVSGQITFMLNAGETAYIWGRWATANKTNSVILNILDITN